MLKGAEEVFIHLHRLEVALGAKFCLLEEPLALNDGVDKLGTSG